MDVEKKPRQMADQEDENVAHHDGREVALRPVVASTSIVVVVVANVVVVVTVSLGNRQIGLTWSAYNRCGH